MGRKEWTLWESGDLTLFETSTEKTPTLTSTNGTDTIVHIGLFADKRNFGDLSDGDDDLHIKVDGKTASITYTY